jgi:hypothetical protein
MGIFIVSGCKITAFLPIKFRWQGVILQKKIRPHETFLIILRYGDKK